MLEPCATQILRTGRYRGRAPLGSNQWRLQWRAAQQQARARHLAGRARGGETDLRDLRHATREINGLDTAARRAARHGRCRSLVEGLHSWLLEERVRLSKHDSVAKAIDEPMPPKGDRWAAFTAFLDDARICLTNNAAERALRGIALGRKSWHFAGSERGGERAAFMYTLITSCKMNDIDPPAWMADVLTRLPDIIVSRLPELLPWNWKAEQKAVKAA